MPSNLVVVGQGYVGLPLSQEGARAGFRVTGLDTSRQVTENLNAGTSHIDDLSDKELVAMLQSGYSATTNPEVLRHADVIVICVPTPLSEDGGPDLRAVKAAARDIAPRLKRGALVVLESTTYPGTTDELLLPILQNSSLKLDEDFFLAFSPERIDPGNSNFNLRNTPKIVGGSSDRSTEVAMQFYSHIVDSVVPVAGTREAETAKLLENTYRHINIALVNEMARFCHELNIDLWDVIRAASSKPFGFQAFYPGPGVGGHCIPIDPNYLSHEVKRTLGYPFRFVELAQEINSSMPKYIVDRCQDMLNDSGKAVKGAKVLLLGVTYKANITDQRESPAIPVAKYLVAKGADVAYHDPRVPEWNATGVTYQGVSDLDSAVMEADMVVLLQNHREYDVDSLAVAAQCFLDTRGATKPGLAVRL